MIQSRSVGERVFNKANYFILFLLCIATIYPFYYVAIISISNGNAVMRKEVTLLPVGINFKAYQAVFQDPNIVRGYINTILYTTMGTIVNLIVTGFCAYPLSVNHFIGRKFFTGMIVITMFFGGGMIPRYLVVKSLGMLNTIWAMILPSACVAWNMIIMRTFFKEIPNSIRESAFLDGANDIQIFIRIILPLSRPLLATMTLFFSVAHWNSFFPALLYMESMEKMPVQMIIRNMVIEGDLNAQHAIMQDEKELIAETIKYAAIMITSIPIIMVYPFLQKYFTKGVMIGAVKG